MRKPHRSRWFIRIVGGALVIGAGWLHAGSVVSHPYRGVTQIVRTETSPRSEHINVMQIDLTTPGIRFLLSNGNNPVNSTNCEVTTAKTLDYMTAQNGQIAINAHFFQAFSASDPVTTKWVVGLAASQGYVYSSFEGPTPATANPVGSLTLTQDYAIMTNAPALNIDALNNAQIVHYDASYADKKHVLEPVTLYNAVCGSAQIVTNGVKSIPTYTGNAATGLISNGTYSDSNSWYNAVNARTAIGLSADNHTLTLFTIDNAGGSNGMTVGEVADMLRTDYQVWNGLNLDGGGSTTMALQDPVSKVRSVINTSSNGATPRIVATSLVVFADPLIAVEEPVGTNLTDGNATINCGSVNLGGKSAALTFTVRNSGAADLTGLAVTKTGANAGEFTLTALGAATLAPNTSTTFTVTFAPGAAGPRSAALQIASNDTPRNPFDINLTGAGVAVPAIAVEEPVGTNLTTGGAPIDCGSVTLGNASGALTFTVRNTGTGNLTGLAVTADGANAADFAPGSLGSTTLAPGASTAFSVTFMPTGAGPRAVALHLASNDASKNPFNINLTGTGVAVPAIAVEQPAGTGLTTGGGPIDCGSVTLGNASSAIIFTVRNTGTGDLTGLAVTADGANAADFSLGSLGAITLATGASTAFSVTFAPAAAGPRGAALHLASNDAGNNPFNINLTGTGVAVPAIAVEEPVGTNLTAGGAPVDCGSVDLGKTSSALTFTVRNTGTGNLTGLAVTADGTNAADFTLGSLGATTLAPGASTTFSVTFAPAAAGPRGAAIHLASNDAGKNPFNINLTGKGVAVPALAVEQPVGTNLTSGGAPIDCGSVTLGNASSAIIFTVRNTGTGDLSGLAGTADGTNAAEFTLGSLGATTLAPGASTAFSVTFAPAAAGPRGAAIHLASNDATQSPFDIGLTGTGVATALQSWRLLHFGSVDNSGDGADLNDFDQDGLPNLIEYAFGLDPKQDSAGMLPQPQLTATELVISFNQPAEVSGITYGAEWSETLLPESWTALSDLGTPPQHSFSVPTANRDRLYLRLTVTLP